VLMDIDIEIAGKLGDPVEVDSGGFLPVRKWISKVNGRIVDFSLFADAQARTPFARLSPERKSTYEAAKAQLQAEEQADARINQAFSWPLLARQFNALKAGEKADVRHTRLPSTGALARDVSTPAGTRFRIDQLAATYSHEQRDGAGNRIGPSLRFTNPNPLDGIELPAEISQRVSANPAAVVVNRLYQPVGVVDDEAARRSVLMAQIVAIEIEVNEGERRFRHLVPVPGDLKPFVFQRDERPVSAFEISGLKAGISPQAVEEVFGRKFGSVAEYDPKARTQRTGGSDCAAWMPNGPGRQPCATAEFDVLGRGWFGGETIGLTRLSIVQNLDAGQIDGFVAGFIKQFGEPRLKIETANTLLLSWGAVASRHRDGNADAQAALHVAEVEIRKFRGGVATRFLLTNPAYFLNRDAAASVQRTSQRSSGL
jgi:hypothetical protein